MSRLFKFSLFLVFILIRRPNYQQHFFFWFYRSGVALAGAYAVASAGWLSPVGAVWFPLAGVLGYSLTVWAGRSPAAAATWWSLVGVTVTGGFLWGLPPGVGTHAGGLVVDAVSAPFAFLTVTLTAVVVTASVESIRKNQFLYYLWVLLLGAVLTLCFCVEDFFVFYVLFELLGFPMFLLIGQYGPRKQRVGAAYKFFVYTFGGSAFILPVLVYLQFWLGSTSVFFLREVSFTQYEQLVFFGLCSVPFVVKVPLVPFHLWLPEAHVEAPTPISMVLAGLLLKTGGYAFLRFLLPVFPAGAYLWGPAAAAAGLFSVGAASLYALVQVDMKRMIAYASVAHMSLVFVGFFTGGVSAPLGCAYLMVAHGYTSAGLFAGIGVLYDRYHTRTVRYYGGLAGGSPLFGILFFVLTLGNLSFPFTGSFVGEFIILAGLTQQNFTLAALAGTTVFLSVCYSVWLFNRLFYGGVGSHLARHQDLTPHEFSVLAWCAVGCVSLGFTGASLAEWAHPCYRAVLQPWLPG